MGMGQSPADRETRQVAAGSRDAVPEFPDGPPLGSDSPKSVGPNASQAVVVTASSASEPNLSQTPASPSTRPCSRATTAVSSPGRPRYSLPRDETSRPPERGAMVFVAGLAGFADFTNIFLSGLVIPLIPTLLQDRTHVPHDQVQIWTSVLVSAYGGAFAVASPFMPLTRRGSTSYGVFFVGLSCAAASLALLQLSSDLYLLIIARALQGLAAAAITRASAGMLASTANNTALWLTPALVQNAGMTAAPFIAGLLHDHYNANAVFYCGYTLIFLNILLGLAAFNTSAARQLDTVSDTEDEALLAGTSPRGYGTMPSGQGRLSTRSRSISPTSPLPLRSPAQGSSVTAASWSPRLLVALLGYLVVGLLTSALHSVLPLFVQRHFNWSVSQAGYLFVPLSAPAAIIGPLSGMFTAPVPRSTRFLTTVGFLAYVPAFLYLGQLTKNTELVRQSFLLTLCNLSVATGLSAEPLVKEIANALGSSASDSSIATAQATSFSNTANAWGSLVGPLLAGFVSELWGWQAMTKTLGVVAATSGVGSLLFLQGWIGNPYPDIGSRRLEARSDEESAPLLANEQPSHNFYGRSGVSGSKQDDYRTERQNSDDVSPRARKNRGHRRHFSVDNFSVTTTTAGSMDSSTSSVRFQAALETPAQGPRPETSDSACKASSERRYVMREAPHAPSTDPLLAAGSLYVIDEERDTNRGVESQRQKRRVVVFPEGSAPPELLERHRHHIVAINALDGTAQMVSDSTDNHAVHVTEEAEADEGTFSEATCRRYVVVVVEGEDYESV